MSLLLLTGPLWWLPLSQLWWVWRERGNGEGGGGGGRERGETEGHVCGKSKRREEERKDVNRKVIERKKKGRHKII